MVAVDMAGVVMAGADMVVGDMVVADTAEGTPSTLAAISTLDSEVADSTVIMAPYTPMVKIAAGDGFPVGGASLRSGFVDFLSWVALPHPAGWTPGAALAQTKKLPSIDWSLLNDHRAFL
jgi:hypothetical protein